MGCQNFGKPSLIAYNTVLGELSKYSYFIPMGLGTASNMLGGHFHQLITNIIIASSTISLTSSSSFY
jgi:hypothetical protein